MKNHIGIAALVCVALGCLSARSVAAPAPDALARYQAQLRMVSAELSANAKQQRRLPKARLPLPAVHVPPAPLAEKPVYSPSLDDWLQSNLRTIAKLKSNRERAARLTALALSLRAVGQLQPAVVQPPSDAHAAAARILSGPAYKVRGAGPAPAPHPSIWQRIVGWFVRMFAEIFGRIFESAAKTPFIGQILAVILLLALLVAIGYAAYALMLRFQGRAAGRAQDLGEALAPPADPELLYQRGLTAAAQGHYAQAIVLLFQASLAYFDRSGKVRYDAARTAGEYRRLVRRAAGPASPHFDALARTFTVVAYAEQTPSAQDWSAAQDAFLALRPLVVS